MTDIDRDRRRRLYFWIRVALVVCVTTIATILFMGVPTTDNPSHSALPHEALYRAISLFAMGAQGMPAAGLDSSHPFAYIALWVAYFLAPALTATFAADAVRKLRSALRTPGRTAAAARSVSE